LLVYHRLDGKDRNGIIDQVRLNQLAIDPHSIRGERRDQAVVAFGQGEFCSGHDEPPPLSE
jgi:hypothetical protein